MTRFDRSLRLLAFVALGLAAGCAPDRVPPAAAGAWVFSAETRAGFTRSCAPLVFDGEATFTVEPRDTGRLRVAFDDRDGTVMSFQPAGEQISTTHPMPTGEVGRMCGRNLQVSVRLRHVADDAGERLVGRWQPTDCGVCPGVELAATRAR